MSTAAARRRPTEPTPLTVVGNDHYSFSPSLVMVSSPGDAAAEAIRALRTHIMAQHIQEGRRALAVCAASAGVGCTFIASNLAVALSQIGVKTLLIDADLRRPGRRPLYRLAHQGPGLGSVPGVGRDRLRRRHRSRRPAEPVGASIPAARPRRRRNCSPASASRR